jgi:hypothetical protein
MGLKGRYIGDGYPLCSDLPKHHFLKKGAKYHLMGYSTTTELGIVDPSRWTDDSTQIRFAPDPSGHLYRALCDPDEWGSCHFPPVVTLPDNIECTGDECEQEMDSIRTVKVFENVFYEYIQPACVYQAFYPNPQKIKQRFGNKYMCADPRI